MQKSMAHHPSHLLSQLNILEFPSSPNLSFKLCAFSPIPYRRIFYAFISASERPSKTAENRGRLALYVENQDKEAVSHSPISNLLSNKTLTILTATSLGQGLGFLYSGSPQTVNHLHRHQSLGSSSQGLQIPHPNQFFGRPSLFLQVSDENLFRRIHALQLQPFSQHQEDKDLRWRGQLAQVYAFSARRRNGGFRSWGFENWVQVVEEFHVGFGRVLGNSAGFSSTELRSC